MGNVTLPTPLVVAGAALCALAGALVGFVLSPDSSHDSTATVASFDAGANRLCLSGDAVADEPGVDADGQLCGTWRRQGVTHRPQAGESFRYVAVRTSGTAGGEKQQQVLIYGDVVRD